MKEYRIRPYDEKSHQGLVRHALIRKGFKSGEIMVCLVINGKRLPHGEELVKRLSAVNFQVVREMMLTWVLTFPGCGVIGFLMAKLFMVLF